MIATMTAENWPGLFAAGGILNPIEMSRTRNYDRDETELLQYDNYQEWLKAVRCGHRLPIFRDDGEI